MNFRDQFQVRIHRLQMLSSPILIAMLAANLSITVANIIQWRGIPFKTSALLIFSGMVVLMLVASEIYVKHLGMYRSQARSNVAHNPYAVDHFTPWEIHTWTHTVLPQLKAMADLCEANGLHQDARDLRTKHRMIRTWIKSGKVIT